jgi:hypothetical protein
MDVTVDIKGLAALDARLQEIGALGGQKLVRRVLRKIAKPMMLSAQANAQSIARSGALAASIAIYNKRPKGAEVAKVAVGSVARNRTAVYVHNAAYQRQRKGIFYGWMVERGHRIGTRRTGTLSRRDRSTAVAGRAQPKPWFEPAVRSNEARAISAFVSELDKALRRIEKRQGKTPNPENVVPE